MNGTHLALGGVAALAAAAGFGRRGSANHDQLEFTQAIIAAYRANPPAWGIALPPPPPGVRQDLAHASNWRLDDDWMVGSLFWAYAGPPGPTGDLAREDLWMYATPFWEGHRGIAIQLTNEDGDTFNVNLYPRWTGNMAEDVELYFAAMKPVLDALDTLRQRGRLARDIKFLFSSHTDYWRVRHAGQDGQRVVQDRFLKRLGGRHTKAERQAMRTLVENSDLLTRRVLLGGRVTWMMDKRQLTAAEAQKAGLEP